MALAVEHDAAASTVHSDSDFLQKIRNELTLLYVQFRRSALP
jgi:hypothetical protein